jgi:hypothetical protein
MFPNPGKHISKYFLLCVERFTKKIILGYTRPQEKVHVVKLKSASS